MKRGLLELAIVTGLLLAAAAGAFALRGDEIRAWLGLRPPARAAPAGGLAAPVRETPAPASR